MIRKCLDAFMVLESGCCDSAGNADAVGQPL
jgi:hypothetical protein